MVPDQHSTSCKALVVRCHALSFLIIARADRSDRGSRL